MVVVVASVRKVRRVAGSVTQERRWGIGQEEQEHGCWLWLK